MYIEIGPILHENRKWSSKNEFSMLEAESFFPNSLNDAYFHVIKRKNESEVKMIKFRSIQVLQSYAHCPCDMGKLWSNMADIMYF